jgi:hypothetical protein
LTLAPEEGAAAKGNNIPEVSSRPIRRLQRVYLVASLVALMLSGLSMRLVAREEFPEYQLKAAFLFNFAKFVTWPERAFASPDTPLTIGIVGDDPFGPLLRDIVVGKTANGRRIQVKNLRRDDKPGDCHILFISRSEKDRVQDILASIQNRNVLTVSEVERFAHSGGVINLVVVAESVRFEINPQAAERAGLQVSSKLVGLGIIVKTDPRKEGK